MQETPRTFVVSANGREIIVHFQDSEPPAGKLVELTVRERCFRPQFCGAVYIQTMGMEIGHAADPGAFSYGRPLVIRRDPGMGFTVRRTLVALPAGSAGGLDNLHYKSVDDPKIFGNWQGYDTHYSVQSTDSGKRWEVLGGSE